MRKKDILSAKRKSKKREPIYSIPEFAEKIGKSRQAVLMAVDELNLMPVFVKHRNHGGNINCYKLSDLMSIAKAKAWV